MIYTNFKTNLIKNLKAEELNTKIEIDKNKIHINKKFTITVNLHKDGKKIKSILGVGVGDGTVKSGFKVYNYLCNIICTIMKKEKQEAVNLVNKLIINKKSVEYEGKKYNLRTGLGTWLEVIF